MKIVDVNGSEVSVSDGETFEVRLPENASTGYQWVVVGLADEVELLGDDTVASEPLVPGAQGLHCFRFIARGTPRGRVALELRRSWERLPDPEDRFEVRVSSASPRRSALEDAADEGGIDDLDDTL